MNTIRHYRDLNVYQNAMDWIVRIFELTKSFPSEERYSLTDQIRRSSRSVCANLGEAWRKRRYEAAFVSKLSDAETEAAETQVHAEVAWRCGYFSEAQFQEIDASSSHFGWSGRYGVHPLGCPMPQGAILHPSHSSHSSHNENCWIDAAYDQIISQIVKMASQPEKWLIRRRMES